MANYNRKNEREGPKLASASRSMRLCKACGKEFEIDTYLDHVYENDECYRAYLASEKKEMSKQ
jgi:hypothetical protein